MIDLISEVLDSEIASRVCGPILYPKDKESAELKLPMETSDALTDGSK